MLKELKSLLVRRGNIRVLFAIYLLSGIYFSMIVTILQPFVLMITESMAFLGFLFTLAHYRRGVLTMIALLIGGLFGDLIGRKPIILISRIVMILSFFFFILSAIFLNPWLLIIAAVLRSIALFDRPTCQALAAESVEVEKRGTAYSLLISAFMAPGIFTATIGGWIADTWGFIPVFLIGILAEGISLIVSLVFIKETLISEKSLPSLNEIKASIKSFGTLFKKTKQFYIATSADMLGWGFSWPILYGVLYTYGFTRFQIGVLESLVSASWFLFQVPMGRLVDKYGSKALLLTSDIIGVLVITGWMFSRSFEQFALIQLFNGAVMAAWIPAMLTYMANSIRESDRAKGLGSLNAFRGFVGAPAPFIAGLLFELYGFSIPLIISLIFVIIALILISFLKEPKPIQFRQMPIHDDRI